ncbi:MAG: class I SAM-dependent rRNA methyltransferase [Chloroflexi bacterium]|nr:MAG: class I SAM-dependent rRNA methyltransferase [Chloroflexota bacterium]
MLHPQNRPVVLRLRRDLVRLIKQGHPWVFADALRELPEARPGSAAVLLDHRKGREIARGIYDPLSPLALRVCTTDPAIPLDTAWAEHRFAQALALRRQVIDRTTTGFRLFNGEGDGLPGLVCDLYGDTAVLQLDGDGPAGFWNPDGIARWLVDTLSVNRVYLRPQSRREEGPGRFIWGRRPGGPVPFLENSLRFTADIVAGQKTGFYLDQRDNRRRIGRLAEGRRVLNLFGYTGGFSVYAGTGGAAHVLTVDQAGPALAAARDHWELNGLPPEKHRTTRQDAFAFLTTAIRRKEQWDLVIIDPPSFAPNRQAVPRARQAYRQLAADGAAVTASGGVLALASCSSHIREEEFLSLCQDGLSRARRTARLLGVFGQPADHPSPLAAPEFRYLKFVLLVVEAG